MRRPEAVYSQADLAGALQATGLSSGDTVFLHIGLDALGRLDPDSGSDESEAVLSALQSVLGPAGTILVPTYTFSFCRQEPFDPAETPSAGGPWSPSLQFLEFFRRQPGARRSRDPIHSVAGLGRRARELLDGVAPTCFGTDSVFDRLKQLGGKICLIGLPLEEATFRHHAEEHAGVPFRFKKLFTGRVREHGEWRKTGWLYSVRILADQGRPSGDRLEQAARAGGICRAAPVGAGEVMTVEAQPYFDFTVAAIQEDPWFTAQGPAVDPVAAEACRVGAMPPTINLPERASMGEMIDRLWRLPRDIISDGYDCALQALASQVPMTIHEYPSGRECWSWIVPEKWTCHEAYLETLDGQRVFSYADNPLHVVSYSLPMEGEVSRDELFRHLHVHPTLPDAIPFQFKYYDRDWGLCCSARLREQLNQDRYRVVIRTDFSYGTLKVGEVVVPGHSDETVVLCAHLCHPGMVNDDLTGVVVGIDVMRALLERARLRYTYRLLIVPETIGSIAFLSAHPDLIPRMRGGLFLEMLGRDHPHGLQLSFGGTAAVDHCFTHALLRHDPQGWTTPFRSLAGNDERQFNAPGVRVPMLALTRQLPPDAIDAPYREYHSSWDTPDLVPPRRLEESRDLVLRMLQTLEADVVPVNRFRGEVFCSRYGIFVNPVENPEGNEALFEVMFLIDGTRSIGDIARACGISFEAAQAVVDELYRHGLVEY